MPHHPIYWYDRTNKWFKIVVRRRDDIATLNTYLDFILQDLDNEIKYTVEVSQFEKRKLVDINMYNSAYEIQIQQVYVEKFLERIINEIYMAFRVDKDIYPYEKLYCDIRRILSEWPLYTYSWNIWNTTKVKEEIKAIIRIDNIPEDVKEALKIAELAQEYQKDIMKKTIDIKEKQNQYYKKYWTFFDKALAYLKLK